MTEQAHIDAMKRSAWGTTERDLTWRYLRPHWRRLIWVVAMAFASSGFELLRMGLLLAFLGATPLRIAHWIPRVALETGPLLVGLVLVSLAAAGLDWWRRHVANLVQRDFTESLRADVCLTMLHRPLDWFTANPAGQASYLLNGQVGRFSTLVPMASDGMAAILQALAVVALMLWTSVPLTALALVGSFLLWLCLHPLHWRIRRLSVDVSVDSGKAAAKAEECAYAIKLIKSCRTETFEQDRYAALAGALADKQVKLSDLRNAAGGLTLVGFVGILAGSVWAAPNGTVLAGFGVLLLRLYPCLTKLIEARTALATMSGHLAAVADFMAYILPMSYLRTAPLRNIRALGCTNLGFFYGSESPVLSDVSFVIGPGEAVALVGLTGSGKTTLLDILAGLRNPSRGDAIRAEPFAYVTQEPILLSGSVSDNIHYSATRLWPSDWKTLNALPVDFDVGTRGAKVSGGQRQLIALARLKATDSAVQLLDEPTSSLDAEKEETAIGWLLEEKKDRIILMATHKLSLAARFDRILVLHHGKIVQDGTHEDLVEQDGLYQRLWRLQEVA